MAIMGIEYLIAIEPKDDDRWGRLFERLEIQRRKMANLLSLAEVTKEGIYFYDNGRSATAAVAFRQIIDHALVGRDLIIIRESR